jgi:peptidoglycan/xylan/chitin deacetylase (PgdA/CDA1 family)
MASKLFSSWKNNPARVIARRALAPIRRRAVRRAPRAGILMYHRITDEAVDPWRLCVTPRAFDEQMAVLARHRAAVDLTAFADGSAFDGAGSRLAVTFDDAYIDNLTVALPILEKYEIPATIYIVSRALGKRREFWWDALVRAILESGPLPARLEIELGGKPHAFDLAEQAGDSTRAADWIADEDDPRTAREQLYLDLWNAIVVLDPPEQEVAVDTILAWAGMPVAGPVDRYPALPEEVAALAGHPLVRIGSHTRHHRSLTDLDSDTQFAEITGGHREIEALMGGPVDRFSFPFGRYDRSALAHVQAIERDGDSFARWLREDHGLMQGVA